MTEVTDPGKGSRRVRVSGAIRFIDAPNSRIGLEVDLSLLPWDLFDALGRRVTLVVHSDDGPGEGIDEVGDHLERALRYVEHAAERTREFAQQEGEGGSDWWKAHQTWEWLRTQLLGTLEGGETALAIPPEPAPRRADPGPDPDPPSAPRTRLPPDARTASVLSYMLGAIHSIPVGLWEESVTSLHPEAPTREEALRTVTGLIRSLRGAGGPGKEAHVPHSPSPDGAAFPSSPAPRSAPSTPGRPTGEAQASTPPDPEDISLEEAWGFDEGYRKGRSVGRALGRSSRRTPEG